MKKLLAHAKGQHIEEHHEIETPKSFYIEKYNFSGARLNTRVIDYIIPRSSKDEMRSLTNSLYIQNKRIEPLQVEIMTSWLDLCQHNLLH